jgi:hypothetical protein
MRRHPNGTRKPRLTVSTILAWADAFQLRHGQWPHHFSGPIDSVVNETWGGVNDALARGSRGLTGGSSLARLLYRCRGIRSPQNVPPLHERKIFQWAKRHFCRTGQWPKGTTGPVVDAPGETWAAIDLALQRGTRDLPGGSSVARLLEERGATPKLLTRPPLTAANILAWADAFFRRHGHWPFNNSGAIPESPGDTWMTIDKALRQGRRGLPGRMSLVQFLNKHRRILAGKTRRPRRVPKAKCLSLAQVVSWANAYRQRTGIWPNRESGTIPEADGLCWSAVNSALVRGHRGLPGGLSLCRLFGDRRKRRRARN